MTYTYAIMDVSKIVFGEVKRKLIDADYGHALQMQDGSVVLDMHGIALREAVARIPDPSEIASSVSPEQRQQVADLLLHMMQYKHGPASAREWVDGVFAAVEAWQITQEWKERGRAREEGQAR